MTDQQKNFISNLFDQMMTEDASSLQSKKTFEDEMGFPSQGNRSLPNYSIVIDACVMRNEIRRYIGADKKLTFIQETHRSGVGVIHAPKWLETELETSTLPSLYKIEGISPRVLARVAEQLIEEINVHASYNEPLQSIHLAQGVDIKDEPYVRLARDIDALGVLTRDKGFSKYKINTFQEDIVKHMQYIARLLNAEIQIRTAGKLTTTVTVNMAGELLKASTKSVRNIPKPYLVGGGLVIAGGAYYFFTQTETGRKKAKAIGAIAMTGLKNLSEFYMNGVNQFALVDRQIAELRQTIER